MATLHASENPVPFFRSGTGPKTIDITWDSGSPIFRGWVQWKLNGVDKGRFDNPFLPQPQKLSVNLGDAIELILHADVTSEVLATLTVTTYLKLLLPGGLDIPIPQKIEMIGVTARADYAVLQWQTKAPDACRVTIESNDGQTGLQPSPEGTTHEAQFLGLTQDTGYSFTIVTRNGDAEYSGVFWTGTREVSVFFESVHVRDDSDTGPITGAGDFSFRFGFGDVDSRETFGHQDWDGDIESGHAVTVDKSMSVYRAPRTVWLQTGAVENDYSGLGLGVAVPGVGWRAAGSEIDEKGDYTFVTVTDYFDLDQIIDDLAIAPSPSGYQIADTPFKLSTGKFAVAFDVHGRLVIRRKDGSWASSYSLDIFAEVAEHFGNG